MTTARDVIAKAICNNRGSCSCQPGHMCVTIMQEADRILTDLLSAPDSVRQELAALLSPWRAIEMVERAAEALCDLGESNHLHGFCRRDWTECEGRTSCNCRKIALAVLEAALSGKEEK